MRRTGSIALALVIACAPQDQDTAIDAANREVTIDDFVGTWDGSVSPEGSTATAATMELMATPSADGWSFTVASSSNPLQATTSPARVVEVGGDSVVVEAGPFASVLRPGEQVSTHSVYRLRGDTLIGLVHATYDNGREVVLTTRATRRR